jgi:hypothetical protein
LSPLQVVRDWWWRALVSCTTCKEVVIVGPATPRGAYWACYLVGFTDSSIRSSLKHMGKCAGGALEVVIESMPPTPAPPPAAA